MEPPKTLLLTETGLALLPDGATAVNVGPIVRALKFLTEGRGDDRGLDEAGNPLPDLMSLAFEVVESIIVGGRKADYFRRVKSELDAQAGGTGRSSLALAKRASRVQHAAMPEEDVVDEGEAEDDAEVDVAQTQASAEALEQAGETLQSLLAGLQGATAQLLGAMQELGTLPTPKRKSKPKAKRKPKAKAPVRNQAPRRAAPKKKRAAPVGAPPKPARKRKRKRKSR